MHNDLLLRLPSSPINAMIQLDLHPPLEIIALPGHLLGSNTPETVRVLLNLLGPDKLSGFFHFILLCTTLGLGLAQVSLFLNGTHPLCLCMP